MLSSSGDQVSSSLSQALQPEDLCPALAGRCPAQFWLARGCQSLSHPGPWTGQSCAILRQSCTLQHFLSGESAGAYRLCMARLAQLGLRNKHNKGPPSATQHTQRSNRSILAITIGPVICKFSGSLALRELLTRLKPLDSSSDCAGAQCS